MRLWGHSVSLNRGKRHPMMGWGTALGLARQKPCPPPPPLLRSPLPQERPRRLLRIPMATQFCLCLTTKLAGRQLSRSAGTIPPNPPYPGNMCLHMPALCSRQSLTGHIDMASAVILHWNAIAQSCVSYQAQQSQPQKHGDQLNDLQICAQACSCRHFLPTRLPLNPTP
jgi:hypothetical protein